MRITKRQLRGIIKEEAQYFRQFRGEYKVDMVALNRAKPIIADWVDLLLDELKNETPQAENIPDEKRDIMIKAITDGAWKVLPDLFAAHVPMEPGAKRLGEGQLIRLVTRHVLREVLTGNIQRQIIRDSRPG